MSELTTADRINRAMLELYEAVKLEGVELTPLNIELLTAFDALIRARQLARSEPEKERRDE